MNTLAIWDVLVLVRNKLYFYVAHFLIGLYIIYYDRDLFQSIGRVVS